MLPIRGRKKPAEMVKAPRSKGCRVCVQRRIKCDQTKPHCLRCQRAHRECPGFESTKFVDEGPTLKALYEDTSREHSRKRQPSESSSSSSQDFAYEDGKEPGTSVLKGTKHSRRVPTPVNSENWVTGQFERNAMLSIVCPTAYQDQLLGQFIESVRQPVEAPTFRCHSIWLREIALSIDPLSCLTWAVRAISLSHLGRKIRDPDLIETSRRIYGKALLTLNEALQDPVKGLSSDTLSATVILSFYEVFNCTDRHSWIKHAGGAGHLIKIRGPARHRAGVDRAVFVACRYSLIMESFQSRTPCFLDEPEWRALGWEIHHDLRREYPDNPILDANELFFQELICHPRYLSAAIKAVSDPVVDLPRLQELYNTGHHHRINHQNIHARMTEEVRLRGDEPKKVPSRCDDRVFPVVYDYRDIHLASLYCGYWAILCAINVSLIGLQARIAGRTENPLMNVDPKNLQRPTLKSIERSSTPLWDAASSLGDTHLYIAENAVYAREICKSAEFMERATFVGPLSIILTLRMALRMGITRKEKEWVLKKLDDIGTNMGLARSEVEIYHMQRGEAVGIITGGPRGNDGRPDAPLHYTHNPPKNMNAKAGYCRGEGMMRFVEGQGLEGIGVGTGIETPGMGVVIPDTNEDGKSRNNSVTGETADAEPEERGLDRAGPPGAGGSYPRWDDPTLAEEPSLTPGGGGFGWGDRLSSGYDFRRAPTTTTATSAATSAAAAEIPTMKPGNDGGLGHYRGLDSNEGGFVGLGAEWEESMGQWRTQPSTSGA